MCVPRYKTLFECVSRLPVTISSVAADANQHTQFIAADVEAALIDIFMSPVCDLNDVAHNHKPPEIDHPTAVPLCCSAAVSSEKAWKTQRVLAAHTVSS